MEIVELVWVISLRCQPLHQSGNCGIGGNSMANMPEVAVLHLSGNSGKGMVDMPEVVVPKPQWK